MGGGCSDGSAMEEVGNDGRQNYNPQTGLLHRCSNCPGVEYRISAMLISSTVVYMLMSTERLALYAN